MRSKKQGLDTLTSAKSIFKQGNIQTRQPHLSICMSRNSFGKSEQQYLWGIKHLHTFRLCRYRSAEYHASSNSRNSRTNISSVFKLATTRELLWIFFGVCCMQGKMRRIPLEVYALLRWAVCAVKSPTWSLKVGRTMTWKVILQSPGRIVRKS